MAVGKNGESDVGDNGGADDDDDDDVDVEAAAVLFCTSL